MKTAGIWKYIHAERAAVAGQEVAGPLLSLIMAMSGRRQACRDLVGDGLATLADR